MQQAIHPACVLAWPGSLPMQHLQVLLLVLLVPECCAAALGDPPAAKAASIGRAAGAACGDCLLTHALAATIW
jgi:hypothetical protein